MHVPVSLLEVRFCLLRLDFRGPGSSVFVLHVTRCGSLRILLLFAPGVLLCPHYIQIFIEVAVSAILRGCLWLMAACQLAVGLACDV